MGSYYLNLMKRAIIAEITHQNDAHRLMKYREKSGIIAKLRVFAINNRNGSFIPNNAVIGSNTIFPHGLSGIFISSGAQIGNNCTIFHQVTIGSNTLSDSKGYGAPIIGNGVYIGCGAKIIGNVKVGDNVRIGANCVVTDDIPANSTVIMKKPIIIKHVDVRKNIFVPYSINK